MSRNKTCPSCGSNRVFVFYEAMDVPVHSVLLLKSKQDALNCPRGDLVLGFCRQCGVIFNVAFEPRLQIYSSLYEETQGFSETFNLFHRHLAKSLIERFHLRGKEIIEIGCGKGEFLNLLCEMGPNRGVGFDPAYVKARDRQRNRHSVTFIEDFFSEKYLHYPADFIVCKMTLEHIEMTGPFIDLIHKAVEHRLQARVFFQVPDVSRILQEFAFWDIYYEHCSYFSAGSLARLFRRSGFDVTDVASGYQNQVLMLSAKPAAKAGPDASRTFCAEENMKTLYERVCDFATRLPEKREFWQNKVRHLSGRGQRAVIWGGGSKAVSFLTTLRIQNEIDYVVDINPFRQGTYLAGTGHKIVSPHFLRTYKPDVIVVMNPVYRDEIGRHLKNLGLSPVLITV